MEHIKSTLAKIKSGFNSLRLRVILIYFVLTLIPLTAIEVSFYFLWLQEQKDNIINFDRKYLDIGEQTFENEFNKIVSINMIFNTNTDIYNLLLSLESSGSGKDYDLKVLNIQRAINRSLLAAADINSNLYAFTFFDIQDRMIYSNQIFTPDYSPKGEEWYEKIKDADGAPVVLSSDVSLPGKNGRNDGILVGWLVKSPNGLQPMGTAVLHYNLQLFKNLCTKLKNDASNNIILINERNNVIYETNGQNAGSLLDSGLAKKISVTGRDYLSYDLDGVSNIIMFKTIQPYNWKVLSAFPENRLNATIRGYLGRVNTYVLALIYVFALFTLLRFSRQLKPLKQMAVIMKQSVANNFNLKIEINKTYNEIRVLGESFNFMIDRIKELIEREYVAEIKQKDAELIALEAQINPHFLYNTLETIRWGAVKNKQDETAMMIYALSSNLQYSITDTGAKVRIQDEIKWLQNYLFLQKTRFKGRFEAYFNVDESIMGYPVHKLILQPFIENSILHGFSNITEGGILQINIYLDRDCLRFDIIDNGSGFPQGDADILISRDNLGETGSIGIGINNAVKRVAIYYSDFSIRITSRAGKGTSVGISVK